MPKEESVIIKPDHVFDFSLFGKIIPGVTIGERFMRLDTIEEVSYQEIQINDPDHVFKNPANDTSVTLPATITDIQLAIAHSSGSIYFFDDDEERELEAQMKAAIKKSEEMQAQQRKQQEEMMIQAAQEAMRREAQAIQIPNQKPGWIPSVKRR